MINVDLEIEDYVRLTKVARQEGRTVEEVALEICHRGCLTSVSAAGIILPFGLFNPEEPAQ